MAGIVSSLSAGSEALYVEYLNLGSLRNTYRRRYNAEVPMIRVALEVAAPTFDGMADFVCFFYDMVLHHHGSCRSLMEMDELERLKMSFLDNEDCQHRKTVLREILQIDDLQMMDSCAGLCLHHFEGRRQALYPAYFRYRYHRTMAFLDSIQGQWSESSALFRGQDGPFRTLSAEEDQLEEELIGTMIALLKQTTEADMISCCRSHDHSAKNIGAPTEDMLCGKEECSICMMEYEAQDELSLLPCGHIFHQGCWNKWMIHSEKQDCALCRQKVCWESTKPLAR